MNRWILALPLLTTAFVGQLARADEPTPSQTEVRRILEKVNALQPKVEDQEQKDELEAIKTAAVRLQEDADRVAKTTEERALDLDILRSGKLIERGITGGISILAIAPTIRELDHGRGYLETGLEVTPAGYVMLLPGYWWASPERAKFCASKFTTAVDAAQRAADGLARKRAEDIVEQMLRAYATAAAAGGGKLAAVREVRALEDEDFPALVVQALTVAAGGGAQAEDAKKIIADWVAADVIEWTPGVQASCAGQMWGLWMTVPPFTTYEVSLRWNDTPDERAVSRRPVKRWLSFGVGLAPSAYVSILAGVSYNTVDIERENADESTTLQRSLRFWALTAGIAINADIVTAAVD